MKKPKGLFNFIFCKICGHKIHFINVPDQSFIRAARLCEICK